MSATPRNAPCPCGSGKKYKKCCGLPSQGGLRRSGRFPAGSYYRFHLSLRLAQPPIWRRFLLRADASFWDLHEAIQDLGWSRDHLWEFLDIKQKETLAGIPTKLGSLRGPVPDAKEVALASFFSKKGVRCAYEYDFGDSWLHDLVLEEIVCRPGDEFARALLDGEEHFPPEDCGGITGYTRLREYLETGEDPWGRTEEAQETLELHGVEEMQPFDLAKEKEVFGALVQAEAGSSSAPRARDGCGAHGRSHPGFSQGP